MGSSETVIDNERHLDGWLLFAVIAIVLALYSSTVLSFYNVFSDQGAGQSHAPLLLLVSLYLLYRTWTQGGRQIKLRFNYPAMALLAVLSLLWLVLGLVFIEAGQQAALILIVAATLVALLSLEGGARYLIPILLLLTVVPLWSPLIPYLQIAAAKASAFVLETGGMTLAREGYLLVIPNGTFEVADACSGLKFQIVGVTLALIHAQLIRVPIHVMLAYALVASLLAFVSNVLRIAVVVTIGYHFGMTNEYVQDHNFIGWILFSIFFFLFLFFGERKLRQYTVDMPLDQADSRFSCNRVQKGWGLAMALLALSTGPLLMGWFSSLGSAVASSQVETLQQLQGWRVTSMQLTDWAPLWTRGDRTFEGSLSGDGDTIDLFVTEFSRQRQGHEAVNVSHRVYDIDKWSRISRSAKVVELPGGVKVRVEEALLKSPDQKKRLVWQWYRVNDRIVTSKAQAKLNNLIGVITGKPDISVFILSKEIIRNETHAVGVLKQFLEAYLAQSGDLS